MLFKFDTKKDLCLTHLDNVIPSSMNVTSLVKQIKKSEVFDQDFVKCRLEIIQEDRAMSEGK